MEKFNLDIYQKRAENLDTQLFSIKQSHLGTDGGLRLIKELIARLESRGVEFSLAEEAVSVNEEKKILTTNQN